MFTGIPGKFVQVEDTVRSFKAVVNGEYDHLPEAAFYMVGGIEEAVAKAEKLAQEAMASTSPGRLRHFELVTARAAGQLRGRLTWSSSPAPRAISACWPARRVMFDIRDGAVELRIEEGPRMATSISSW